MLKKLLLFIGLLITILINFNNLSAEITILVPIKKPVLSTEEINKKITKNILKPIKKPKKIKDIVVKEEKVSQVKKEEKKLSFKIPKKKPYISDINKSSNIKISKYYNKKDFSLAKKAIAEMQKGRWTSSLKIAKKAKDKSIYNFIQWKHLLTVGNQASFYDYKVFIDQNDQYPRISRL